MDLRDSLDVESVLTRWSVADRDGELDTLDRLLDPEFRGDAPDGSVVGKYDWIAQRRDRAGRDASDWRFSSVNVRNGIAIATGSLAVTNAEYRATVVAHRQAAEWTIVNVQLRRLATADEAGR